MFYLQSRELVLDSYIKVYNCIDADSSYENKEAILRRTPEQIKSLLC